MPDRIKCPVFVLAIMAAVCTVVIPSVALARKPQPPAPAMHCLYNDSHFHLINYV